MVGLTGAVLVENVDPAASVVTAYLNVAASRLVDHTAVLPVNGVGNASLYADVISAALGLAVGEYNGVGRALGVKCRAGAKANGVDKPLVRLIIHPIRVAVLTYRHGAVVDHLADVEVHSAVGKKAYGGLVGVDDLACGGQDLAYLPALAVIAAVEGGNDGGPMVFHLAAELLRYHPKREHESSVLGADAVSRTESEHVSVLGRGTCGDVDSVAPGDAVVVAVAAKHTSAVDGVVLAVEEVDASVLVLHHDGVVNGIVLFAAVRQVYVFTEAFAAVGASLTEDVHGCPVG